MDLDERRLEADLVDESRADMEERLAIEEAARDAEELEAAGNRHPLDERRLTDLAFLIRVLDGAPDRRAIAELCLRGGADIYDVARSMREAFEARDYDS